MHDTYRKGINLKAVVNGYLACLLDCLPTTSLLLLNELRIKAVTMVISRLRFESQSRVQSSS